MVEHMLQAQSSKLAAALLTPISEKYYPKSVFIRFCSIEQVDQVPGG